jgi:hypothetical protein
VCFEVLVGDCSGVGGASDGNARVNGDSGGAEGHAAQGGEGFRKRGFGMLEFRRRGRYKEVFGAIKKARPVLLARSSLARCN